MGGRSAYARDRMMENLIAQHIAERSTSSHRDHDRRRIRPRRNSARWAAAETAAPVRPRRPRRQSPPRAGRHERRPHRARRRSRKATTPTTNDAPTLRVAAVDARGPAARPASAPVAPRAAARPASPTNCASPTRPASHRSPTSCAGPSSPRPSRRGVDARSARLGQRPAMRPKDPRRPPRPTRPPIPKRCRRKASEMPPPKRRSPRARPRSLTTNEDVADRNGWMIQIGATDDAAKANDLLDPRQSAEPLAARFGQARHREGAQGRRHVLSRALRRPRIRLRPKPPAGP